MNYKPSATVNYDVQVRIGGLALVLLAARGKGHSVHGLLFGGAPEWTLAGNMTSLYEPDPSPVAGLLGGDNWGNPLPVDGLKQEVEWE